MEVFPIGLRLQGRRVLVAGGGPVALRRISSLLTSGADVLLVSPAAVDDLVALAARGEITWQQREVAATDVQGAWLVLACTDDAAANAALSAAADATGVWCSRADDAASSRAWVPAHESVAGVVVAVHGAGEVRRAVRLRDAAVRAVLAAEPPAVQ